MKINGLICFTVLFCVINLTACSDDTSDVPPVSQVSLLGSPSVGEFTRNSGNFSLSVAPKDSEGNFIGEVNNRNFSMENVTVSPSGSNKSLNNITAACIANLFIEVIRPGHNEPISLILDFDTSGSMSWNDPNRLSIEAGKEIIDLLRDIDLAGIVEFGGSQAVIVQELTSDKDLLREKINGLSFSGSTPLYHSVHLSLDHLADQNVSNPVVVILADGDNNQAPTDRNAVVAQANQQQTPLYTIALGEGLDFSDLIFFADNTGGIFAEAADAQSLQELFDNFGFSIFEGRVVINTSCEFQPEIPEPGNYLVTGQLKSSIGGNGVNTPFGFSVNITE